MLYNGNEGKSYTIVIERTIDIDTNIKIKEISQNVRCYQ